MVTPPTASSIRDAATVLPLRDGRAGLEVFMVRRHSDLEFLGGAHVFPGGAVDLEDREVGYEAYLYGFDCAHAGNRMEEADGERVRSFYVAAMRELFEESGVLLAKVGRSDGSYVDEGSLRDVLAAHRHGMIGGQRRFLDIVQKERLQLACDALCYLGRWITPAASQRRFDTRFFLARIPDGQSAEHDRAETTAGEWLRPQVALASYARGDIHMVTPTICSLDWLQLHDDVDSAIAATAEMPIVDVVPSIEIDGERIAIRYRECDPVRARSAAAEPGRMVARAVRRDGAWIRP